MGQSYLNYLFILFCRSILYSSVGISMAHELSHSVDNLGKYMYMDSLCICLCNCLCRYDYIQSICIVYMYSLYVYSLCIVYMYSLYVWLNSLYVQSICRVYMYTLYVQSICIICKYCLCICYVYFRLCCIVRSALCGADVSRTVVVHRQGAQSALGGGGPCCLGQGPLYPNLASDLPVALDRGCRI